MIFEKELLRKACGPTFDSSTNEWRKLYNNGLQTQFQRFDIIEGIAKGILTWAGHAQAYNCLQSDWILSSKIQLFYKHLTFEIIIHIVI